MFAGLNLSLWHHSPCPTISQGHLAGQIGSLGDTGMPAPHNCWCWVMHWLSLASCPPSTCKVSWSPTSLPSQWPMKQWQQWPPHHDQQPGQCSHNNNDNVYLQLPSPHLMMTPICSPQINTNHDNNNTHLCKWWCRINKRGGAICLTLKGEGWLSWY